MRSEPGHPGVSTSQIAAQIRDGNAWAESELLQRYGRAVFLILEQRTRSRDLSMGLFREAFRIALLRLRNRNQESPVDLAAFLRMTAVNVAVIEATRHRRLKHQLEGFDLMAAATAFSVPALRVGQERLRAAARAVVSGLGSARDREMLWRHYVLEEDRAVLCLRFSLSGEHFDRMVTRTRQRLRALVVSDGPSGIAAPARRALDAREPGTGTTEAAQNVVLFPSAHPLADHVADYLADRASPEATNRIEQGLLESPVLVEELELHRALRDALQDMGPGASAFLATPQARAVRRRVAAWLVGGLMLVAVATAVVIELSP
jgi:hypothetical protein